MAREPWKDAIAPLVAPLRSPQPDDSHPFPVAFTHAISGTAPHYSWPPWLTGSYHPRSGSSISITRQPDGTAISTFPVDLKAFNTLDAGPGGDLPLYVTFGSAMEGSAVKIEIVVHHSTQPPGGPWQELAAKLVKTPTVQLPRKIQTSLAWARDVSGLLLDGRGGGQVYSALETYARLGFNTVPWVHTDSMPLHLPGYFHKGNRTHWPEGIKFGPEFSPFQSRYFASAMHGPVDVNKLREAGVAPANIPAELLKWERSVNYSKATNAADVAYDGALFAQDVDDFCAAAKLMQPDVFFADAEGWGGGWNTWFVTGGVNVSENAQVRRLPGESYENLAFRMVQEMLTRWMSCMKTGSPRTQVLFYSTQWPQLAAVRAGMTAEQPSDYGMYSVHSWPATVRQQR